jgi:hypothetical protein
MQRAAMCPSSFRDRPHDRIRPRQEVRGLIAQQKCGHRLNLRDIVEVCPFRSLLGQLGKFRQHAEGAPARRRLNRSWFAGG